MRRFMTRDPTADGGYPLDSDLDQMTDDGCPLVPDPAGGPTPTRDNLGESDTFDAPYEEQATPVPANPRSSVRIIHAPTHGRGFIRYLPRSPGRLVPDSRRGVHPNSGLCGDRLRV